MKGRIAWLIVPHLGGMVSCYTSVSVGLRERGWETSFVWAGKTPPLRAGAELPQPVTVLAPESRDVRESAGALAIWVRERAIDILVTLGEPFALAAIPALSARTRVVAKCPNQSGHSYRLVTAYPNRTDLILVETKRQYEDLTRRWSVPPGNCALIANGVRKDVFRPSPDRSTDGPLQIIFVGRLDEATKHVMLLPEIARVLTRRRVEFEMSVIGDGPDRKRLARKFEALGMSNRVRWGGGVLRRQLPALLGKAHAAVIPSRLDGMSWALLESMACGCVPVASRITGTTDTVIRDGENGFLCRMGDAKAFAAAIAKLAGERTLLKRMSLAARQTIEADFSSDRMIDEYDRIFTGLLSRPSRSPRPIPLAEIAVPEIFGHSWRSYIPQSIKNSARTWAQRFGVTI